jgi:hypothetical protein
MALHARPRRSVLVLLSAAAAAVLPLVHGAIVEIFWDDACTQHMYTQDLYLGYCVGSLGMTACSAQHGWASFVMGSSSNDCPGNDMPALSATITTNCTAILNWGYYQYYKLAPNPVCEAPGGKTPTAMAWYSGDKCENSPGEAFRSNVNGVFVWSAAPDECITSWFF